MQYKMKRWIIIISIILVICLPFINGSREIIGDRGDFIKAIYGFPFDWLYLYINGSFSFLVIGFIGSIIFFIASLKF